MKVIVEENDNEFSELAIKSIKSLGSGMGANVHLVQTQNNNSIDDLVAEKRYELNGFNSTIAKLAYRMAFQAPFPYAQNENAIRTAFYTRKVIKTLLDYWRVEDSSIPHVSDSVYTRWDEGMHHYSLGTEYIDGRSVLPLEMDELVSVMKNLNQKFIDTGLIGLAWQTESASSITGVATKNFLKSEDKWYLVDLESGIIPPNFKYLKEGLKLKSLFIFDDIDFNIFSNYINGELLNIESSLGRDRTVELCVNIEFLVKHNTAWKDAETAMFRKGFRMFRKEVRHAYADRILRSKLINQDKADSIKKNVFSYLWHGLISPVNDGMITMARRYLAKGIYEWENKGMLSQEKAESLIQNSQDPLIKGYLQDVGAQIFSGLMSLPIINYPLAGGLAVYAEYSNNPDLLIPAAIIAFPSSIFRLAYSAIRLVTDKTRKLSHIVAGTLGALPTVGHLFSYIPQGFFIGRKHEEFRDLGRYLGYHNIISNIGKITPFFGGEGSRLHNTLLEKTGYHNWIQEP